MAVNEKLTARVRELLAEVKGVEEKKMFRGITFMVDGKMCVSVGDDRIMCRIDPERHAELASKPGCRTVEMGGRPYLGFVYVEEKALANARALKSWIDLALEFNPRATASHKSKAKPKPKPKANAKRTARASQGTAGKTAKAAGKSGKRAKPGKQVSR